MVAAHEQYLYIAFLWRIAVFFFKYVLETFKKKRSVCVATERSRIKLTMTIYAIKFPTVKININHLN